MNSASYFKELESGDVVRSDRHEGLAWARQVKEIAIQGEDGEWIPIGGIVNPVTYHSEESSNFNMFCMYMFTDQPDDAFDERNLDFGDSFVMIRDLPEFLRRVRVASLKLDRTCVHSYVRYVTSAHDGEMGPFRKFDSFSYQREFRIILEKGNHTPVVLEIGDIRDIAYVGNSIELGEIIQTLKRGENVYLTEQSTTALESDRC